MNTNNITVLSQETGTVLELQVTEDMRRVLSDLWTKSVVSIGSNPNKALSLPENVYEADVEYIDKGHDYD